MHQVDVSSLRPRVLANLVGVLVVLALAAGCDRTGGAARLDVAPTAGPPGTVLTLTGLQLDALDVDSIEVFVGTQIAPFRRVGDALAVAIPLFAGDDGWPAPSDGGVGVEVRTGERVLGRSATAVTVTALPEAPGAAREVAAAIAGAAASLEALLAHLPPASAEEAHLRQATFELVRSLSVEGDGSLLALLEGRGPVAAELASAGGLGLERELALVDALLASTGALAYVRALEAALEDARSRFAPAPELWAAAPLPSATPTNLATRTDSELRHVATTFGGMCRGDGGDFELACRLQVQAVLADFTESFVRPTASTYANTVGLAAGVAAVAVTGGAALPVATFVGAMLGVMDFVMTKVVPALLPSRLSAFDLTVDPQTIELRAWAAARIEVAAVNDPPPIGLFEVIEQVVALAGLNRVTEAKLAAEVGELLQNAAKFTLDQYVRILRALEGVHGVGAVVSTDDVRLPLLTWGPVEVTSDDLVTLFSFDEDVVATREDVLGWEGVQLGEATVRVMPRGPGERSRVLVDGVLCPGCSYVGAAFGADVPVGTELVVVGRLDVSATPDRGVAPLATTFSWDGIPVDPEVTFACELDVGDGTTPYRIDDCARTTSQEHLYAGTSALRTPTGEYEAILSVVGTSRTARAAVLADWQLTATPTSGDEPLEVAFAWRGFLPGEAVSCTFEPGDGTPARPIDDCLRTTTATHTYEAKGGYSPTLVARGPAREDLKDVVVDVAEEDPACAVARSAEAWRGSISFAYDGAKGSVTMRRQADLVVELGSRGTGPHTVWWTVLESSGTVEIDDRRRTSTRTESIRGSGEPYRVGGGLTLRLEDCAVTSLRIQASATAVNDTLNGREAASHVALVELFDAPLSGTATLPAYLTSGGAELREDRFVLSVGAQYTDTFAFLAGRFDERAGEVTVTWSFTPVEGADRAE